MNSEQIRFHSARVVILSTNERKNVSFVTGEKNRISWNIDVRSHNLSTDEPTTSDMD